MEKYRTKQMEAIQDNYNRRVQAVKDTYHEQMEQIRSGYSSQLERFRYYRTAQLENVHSHLDALRENYQQQMAKVRDYGSRRADALWESYERQVNRVRMFNLQSRLKIMRQYNLKQRYINKLFENFQGSADPEALKKHEAEVRAALNMHEDDDAAVVVSPVHSGLPALSRSSSFYSLPEYVLDENGCLRPSPLVGTSSSRFERRNEMTERGDKRSKSPEPGPSTSTAL